MINLLSFTYIIDDFSLQNTKEQTLKNAGNLTTLDPINFHYLDNFFFYIFILRFLEDRKSILEQHED